MGFTFPIACNQLGIWLIGKYASSHRYNNLRGAFMEIPKQVRAKKPLTWLIIYFNLTSVYIAALFHL